MRLLCLFSFCLLLTSLAGAGRAQTPQLVPQSGHRTDENGGGIAGLQFSPDGKWLASGAGGEMSSCGQLLIWNAKGQIWAREDNTASIQSLDWSGDSQFLAVGDDEGAKIWSRAEAKFVAQTTWDDGDAESYDGVEKIQCLSDGRVAVYLPEQGREHNDSLQIWNWKSGAKLVLKRDFPSPGLRDLQLSPDEKTLAASSDDGIRIFDLKTGTSRFLRQELKADGIGAWFAPKMLRFSPDGTRLAGFVSDSNRFGTFNFATRKFAGWKKIEGYSAPRDYALNNAGDIVWQLRDTLLERFRKGAKISVVKRAPAPGGQWIDAIAFDRDAKQGAIAGVWGDLAWFNGQTGALVRVGNNANQWANGVSFSPDGKRLVVGYGARNANGSSGELAVFDAVTGVLEKSLAAHRDESGTDSGVNDVQFSPDGKWLVCSGDSKDGAAVIRVFDAKTLSLIRDIELPGDRACKMAFSGDGKSLVVGTHGAEVLLWKEFASAVDGKIEPDWVKAPFQVKNERDPLVLACAISPDKRIVLAGTEGGKLAVFDFASGDLKRVLAQKATPYGAVFSRDGQKFWTGDEMGAILEWDAQTLEVRRTLQKEGPMCGALAVSPDENYLFAARWDKVAVFSLQSGQLERELPASRQLNSLAVSPDGTRVAGADELGVATLWDVQNGESSTRFYRLRYWRDKNGSLNTRGAAILRGGKAVLSTGSEGLVLWRVGDELFKESELKVPAN